MLNSVKGYSNLIEQPCISIKGISENFVWGSNLQNTFKESAPPIFSLTLNMNENGPFYSDDPDLYEVCIILTNRIF